MARCVIDQNLKGVAALVLDDANAQAVPVGASAVASAPILVDAAQFVADVDCYISFIGPAAKGSPGTMLLAAGEIWVRGFASPGTVVSVVAVSTAAGFLYVHPAAQ